MTLEVAIPTPGSVTVPDVVGMKQEAAVTTLNDAGLVAQVAETPDNNQPKGRVWQQSPLAGTSVSPGTTITIFVNPN